MRKTINHLKAFLVHIATHPIAVKLFHTAWQAFLAVWLVSGFSLSKSVLVAAVAAAFSAVKSSAVQIIKGQA